MADETQPTKQDTPEQPMTIDELTVAVRELRKTVERQEGEIRTLRRGQRTMVSQ